MNNLPTKKLEFKTQLCTTAKDTKAYLNKLIRDDIDSR